MSQMSFLLWIIGIGCAVAPVILYIVFRAETKEKERLSAERMAAIEKGLDLPPEVFFDASGQRRIPTNSLLVGLTTLGIGLGLSAALFISVPEHRLWGWGILVVAFGLAHLLYWFVWGRREREKAQALDREMKEAWIRRQSGAAPNPDDPRLSG